MPADSAQISPTPVPAASPDPCAAENLIEEFEKVQDLVKPLLINKRRDNGLELLGGKKCLECILCCVNQQHASSK